MRTPLPVPFSKARRASSRRKGLGSGVRGGSILWQCRAADNRSDRELQQLLRIWNKQGPTRSTGTAAGNAAMDRRGWRHGPAASDVRYR